LARNIEIKARIEDADEFTARVAELADEGPFEMEQDDTFFRCGSGRLKLRAFSETSGELIFYRRTDQLGPKESSYLITPATDPAGLREVLTLAYGQTGRIVKHRTLFLIGRTRVHIDRVEGLGNFMELEVVLDLNESSEAGVKEAALLMERLRIEEATLIEGAYIDMF